MTPKDARIDHTDAAEDPIENQQEDWEEEDDVIDGSKPDLAEIEGDEAGL